MSSVTGEDSVAANTRPTAAREDARGFTIRMTFELVLVFLGSCAVFWGTTRVIKMPPAWRTFEFCQYAEIGRNLAVEGTYDTRLLEPMALALIDQEKIRTSSGRWPVVNRYPWPSAVVAVLMRAAGPTDEAAAWSNGLAIGVLAVLAYAAARVWYGPRWALTVALVFLANPSFYGEFILLGTPDVWFAAFFVAQLLLWSRLDLAAGRRPALAWAFAIGLLSGLAYLARFNATTFVGVQAAALLWHRRWREVLVIGATATVLALPVMADTYRHFHRPLVSLYSTWNLLDGIGAHPVEPWLYYQVPDLPQELSRHFQGVVRKFTTNLLEIVPLRIWSLWRLDLLLPLALMAPMLTFERGSNRRFARWSVALFAFQLVLFSALRLELEDRNSPHHGRYFFWFSTPALLLAVGTLKTACDRYRALRWLATLLIIAQLAYFGWTWSHAVSWHSRGTNIGHDPIRAMLREVVARDQLIASNQPQVTAWFVQRRSISLPADPSELARLNQQSPTPVDYVFIDDHFNCIQLQFGWYLLAQNDPRRRSPWEAELLRDYQYVLPPGRTRPLGYVLLRRRGVPPSTFELQINSETRAR